MSNIDPPASWADIDGINTNERLLGGPFGPLNRAVTGLTARTKQLHEEKASIADLAAPEGAGTIGYRPDSVDAVLRNVAQVFAGQPVQVAQFGAQADGGTVPDATAITKALEFAAGRPVELTAGRTYNLDAPILPASNTHVVLRGQGAVLRQMGNNRLIQVVADYSAQVTVTAVVVESTDLSGGTAGTTPTSKITAPGHGYAVGDVVRILSDALLSGPNPADQEREGEFFIVAKVDGDSVYAYSPLVFAYPPEANVRVARLNKDVRVDIRGIITEKSPTIPTAANQSQIYVEGVMAPYVEAQARSSASAFLVFVGCFGARTSFVRAANLDTSSALNKQGYAIVEYSCEYGQHLMPQGTNCRHVYTTGTLALPTGSADSARYGRTKYSEVVAGVSINSQSAGFDTHPDAYRVTFRGCLSCFPYIGANGSLIGFQARGIGVRFIDCEAEGGYGFSAFSDFAHVDNSRDHEFIRPLYRAHPTYPYTAVYPLRVLGLSGAQLTGVRFLDPDVRQPAGSSPTLYTEFADVYVRGLSLRAARSSNQAVARVIQNSNVVIDGGDWNFTGSVATPGTDGLFLLSLTAGSTIRLTDRPVNVVGGGALIAGICDFNNAAATVIAPGLNLDAPFNGAAAATGFARATNATARSDFWVDGRRAPSVRSQLAVTYDTAGNQNISLNLRLCPVIFVEVTTSTAGVIVTNVGAGLLDGQQIVIRNVVASTATLQVNHNTNRMQFDAAATLVPGAALRLRYDMTNDKWVKA